jgi:hypothetical protein
MITSLISQPMSDVDKWRQLTVGVAIKCHRLHRSILSAIQHGHSREAHILIRALLEATVLLKFIGPEHVKLSNGQIRHDISGDDPLPRDLRVNLYTAHLRYERARWIDDYTQLGLIDDVADAAIVDRVENEKLELETSIIPTVWRTRIHDRRNYHGMKGFSSLATVLGMGEMVKTFYRVSSWAIHAMDGFSFSKESSEGTTFQLEDIAPASSLSGAFVIYTDAINTANHALFGGNDVVTAKLNEAMDIELAK